VEEPPDGDDPMTHANAAKGYDFERGQRAEGQYQDKDVDWSGCGEIRDESKGIGQSADYDFEKGCDRGGSKGGY